ncbi:MAG: acyl-CoA dehydrogenase family protein, partial [Maricaulaceae bacterium]
PLGQVAAQQIGVENEMLADPILRADIARIDIDSLAFALTTERLVDEAKAGKELGSKSALLKYYGTELNKRRYELLMASAGNDGLEWEGEPSHDGALPRAWLRTKANSIEGGTSEVMLNIIAKRVLGLPSS